MFNSQLCSGSHLHCGGSLLLPPRVVKGQHQVKTRLPTQSSTWRRINNGSAHGQMVPIPPQPYTTNGKLKAGSIYIRNLFFPLLLCFCVGGVGVRGNWMLFLFQLFIPTLSCSCSEHCPFYLGCYITIFLLLQSIGWWVTSSQTVRTLDFKKSF